MERKRVSKKEWEKGGKGDGKGEKKSEWGIGFPLTVCLGSSTCSSLRSSHCGTSSTPGCLFLLLGPTCCGLVEARKHGQFRTISTARYPQTRGKNNCSELACLHHNMPAQHSSKTGRQCSNTYCIWNFKKNSFQIKSNMYCTFLNLEIQSCSIAPPCTICSLCLLTGAVNLKQFSLPGNAVFTK